MSDKGVKIVSYINLLYSQNLPMLNSLDLSLASQEIISVSKKENKSSMNHLNDLLVAHHGSADK